MPAPISDLAAHARWHESLSASRERRAAAGRKRRRRFRARTLLMAAALSMLVLSAGVALAASSGGSSSGKSQTLQLGSKGSAVKELQRKLHVSPVSGYFGNETRSAVKRFQRGHGLTADGVAGPATLRKLGIRASGSGYATGGSAPSSGSSRTAAARAARTSSCRASSSGSRSASPAAIPRAVSRSGRYRGKYQFDQATWEAVGGTGDPAAASESTQDRIALRLYHKRGTAPWPNCA